MGILPPNFEAVASFAACERFLRGPGDEYQYDYSLHDVMCIAWAYYRSNNERVPDATIRALTKHKPALMLNQAWARHLEVLRNQKDAPQ